MRLVQVCNVGQICGGTAACAWTITRAFPDWEHHILFLSPPSTETVQAFSHCQIANIRRVNDEVLASHRPDLVILHNTAAKNADVISSATTIQFRHSQGIHAKADLSVSCSKWLAKHFDDSNIVLHQPVPKPVRPHLNTPTGTQDAAKESRHFATNLIVGRICTPTQRKWPSDALHVYRAVASTCPNIQWEFVGCPIELQSQWQDACAGRATFLPAEWQARRHLWRWHALLYHHPTLTESFGRTVTEAMRAGCVPIVDAKGGFIEQIEQERTGYLCASQTDFVAAVDRLSHSAHWWKMSRAAMTAADDNFSLQSFRRRFLSLVKRRATDLSVALR
ncbi:glycosyltransferase family 4 protein [Planctomicrobium sp. SH527]|uniref:glycosyltransferase family 4 protein n=1 Tax=Planctomicrobium sp. SH527 TaxID=3448123 RepID=UPI003F5B6FFB